MGRRIQKSVVDSAAPTEPTKTFTYNFVYDNQEILLQYSADNDLLARYTHSGLRTDDVLAANITSDGVTAGLAKTSGSYMYLKDQLGSITDVTDSTGNKIQHYIYSAFGELLGIQDAQANDVTANPPVNTSYGFTGRERDSESGLMYYRARMYDPASGRFLQKDPSPGKLNLPISVVNVYIYAANNPTFFADPSGKSFWTSVVRPFIEGVVIAAVAIAFVVLAMPVVIGAAVAAGLVDGLASAFMNGTSSWTSFRNHFESGFATGFIIGAAAALLVAAPAVAGTLGFAGEAGVAVSLGLLYSMYIDKKTSEVGQGSTSFSP